MKADSPLVCNMGVFTPSQREAHILTTTNLIRAIQRVQDVENGYEFTFPNESELISRIAEFITNERLCCPFLDFSLHVPSDRKPITLLLTGPAGTREFLRAEFEGAIP